MANAIFPPIAILKDSREKLIQEIVDYKEAIQNINKRSIELASNLDSMEAKIKEFDLAISLLEKI